MFPLNEGLEEKGQGKVLSRHRMAEPLKPTAVASVSEPGASKARKGGYTPPEHVCAAARGQMTASGAQEVRPERHAKRRHLHKITLYETYRL